MNAALLHAIHSGHSVVISGQAGTGKSHLLNTISKELTAAGKTVNVTATTGIASTLLHGAMTLHSCFGLFDDRY